MRVVAQEKEEEEHENREGRSAEFLVENEELRNKAVEVRAGAMSGSRLGRGRGGRLAVYGGCGVVVILLVLLYRAATSEMARLRELHIQCAHQQESLAAQLQVIFEYKVRLEKSLAEEKSSNAAVKQELQQRASREKSLRDKDSVEAMQRFNSLQQTYKLLQTEHQDLQEECKKREKQTLDETNRLESTLQDLRSRIKQANEDKEKTVGEKEQTLQHFKNKYLELETEKDKLENKYNELMKSAGNDDGTIDHLKKEVFQLKRELENEKRQCKATSAQPKLASQKPSYQANDDSPDNTAVKDAEEKQKEEQRQQAIQNPQQVSRPNNDDDMNPEPLHAPRKHHAIGDALSDERNAPEDQDDALPNQQESDVRFASQNDNIIPVGPGEVKEDLPNFRPLPYDLRDKRAKKNEAGVPSAGDTAGDTAGDNAEDELEKNGKETNGEGSQDQPRQVLAPPKKSSSKEPAELENDIQDEKAPNVDTLARPDARQNLGDPRDIDNELDAWRDKELGN
ncbi:hypothetical protein KPH14_010070 [Odynerus spinipes]|uniref:Golgi integral membrane protein 4 n=1 Tax=Odynerus spinipes TaxID=1348599 RepID=A0AAD9RUB8_9HYME|nr:hypothetical protein KPH14_010070 [Odynerus spinipes]